MLEILLSGGNGPGNYIHNSGPGNKKVIVGTVKEGWLGLIDILQMPSIQEVGAGVGLTVSPYTGVNAVKPKWLKAVIDSAVIFIPNGPWTDPLSYSVQYFGGIFGIDAVGPDGATPSGVTPSNQLRYVDWTDPDGRSWLFKVRLIKGNDPIAYTATSQVYESTAEISENHRLHNRVIANTTIVSGDRWDSLVSGVDYLEFRHYDQTFVKSGATHSLSRFDRIDIGQWWSSGTSQAFPWRPVLEVVNPDNTFVYPLGVKLSSTPAAAINSISSSSDTSLITANVITLDTQNTVQINVAISGLDVMTAARNISFENMAVSPINPILN